MGDSATWQNYTVEVDTLIIPSDPQPQIIAFQAVISHCDGSLEQQWVWDAGQGLLLLAANASFCLGLYGHPNTYSSYPNVAIIPCDSRQPQLWSYDDAHQAFHPVSQPDLCLDVLGGASDPGSVVFAYSCNYYSNERWNVQGAAVASEVAPDMCLAAGPAIIPPQNYAQVCARLGSYTRGGGRPEAYCLKLLLNGTWILTCGNMDLKSGIVRSGAGWHRLVLHVNGSRINGDIDGTNVVAMEDTRYSRGMVALGSGWHQAFFDNLVINPLW